MLDSTQASCAGTPQPWAFTACYACSAFAHPLQVSKPIPCAAQARELGLSVGRVSQLINSGRRKPHESRNVIQKAEERGRGVQIKGPAFPAFPQIGIAMTSSKKNSPLANLGRQLGTTALTALALLLATGCEGQASRDAKLKQEAEVAVSREKYAKALFEERCKTAGLVVHRTVKDVEGIQLLRIRKPTGFASKDYFDPMWEDAALAATAQGEDFIKDFLLSEVRLASHPDLRTALRRPERETPSGELPMRPGFAFVEVVEADGVRYRYTLPRLAGPTINGLRREATTGRLIDLNGVQGEIQRERSEHAAPRYAFTYEPIVDPQDRALWVAGVRLKAIDQETGEVLGELTRFVIDTGFGGSATGRWPWQHANTASSQMCPSRSAETTGYTHRHFIDNVLLPKQGV